MPNFTYTVRKPGATKPETGTVEADSLMEATKLLKNQGVIVLKIQEGGSKGSIKLFNIKSVPLKEKIIFTKQLSVMLRAGLPVVKALEALQRQTQHQYFKEVIGKLIADVKGGQQLSKAMGKFPKAFPEVYIAVVRAGEETGQLAEVLLDLAEQQEKDAELIGKIKGAMIYPGIIFAALIGVAFLIFYFVIPSLESVFADAGTELPLLTRILLAISQIIRKYTYVYLPVLVLLGYLLHLFLKTKSGSQLYDRTKISLPIFGPLTKKVYMARFARTMSLLIHASLPILKSLQIVKQTISNQYYTAAFERIEKAVESGHSISSAMTKEPLFPPMVAQLINLGEESGNVESVLKEVYSFYDKEVDQTSKNLATLLEPLMLIIMGVGVAFIVAAVLSPIYKLAETF